MKKKATVGGVSPKPAKNTTGATNRTSGYLNPKAAGNKKTAPKTTVTKSGRKITVTASTSGGGGSNKMLVPGSMASKSKIVTPKPKAAKKITPALKAKTTKAFQESRAAKGNLMVTKEAKKLGNLQGPGVAAKKLREANSRDLDTGRTASRAQNILNKFKNK